jgi:hypothetical protein
MRKALQCDMYVVFKRGRRVVGTVPIYPVLGVPVMHVGKEKTPIRFPEPIPKECGEAAKILSIFMLVNEAVLRMYTHPICRQCGESFERGEPNDQFCTKECKRAYYDSRASERAENKRTAMKKSRTIVSDALKRGVTFK